MNTNFLDNIAKHIKSAECLNAIHACRKDHPLGVNNPYKWRNAYAMVCQQDYFIKSNINFRDMDNLKRLAAIEA